MIADLQRLGLKTLAHCLDALKNGIGGGIPPFGFADILEQLAHYRRFDVFQDLTPENASAAPVDAGQHDLIDALDSQMIVDLVDQMSPEQAAQMLATLPADQADELLLMIDAELAPKVFQLVRKLLETAS